MLFKYSICSGNKIWSGLREVYRKFMFDSNSSLVIIALLSLLIMFISLSKRLLKSFSLKIFIWIIYLKKERLKNQALGRLRKYIFCQQLSMCAYAHFCSINKPES